MCISCLWSNRLSKQSLLFLVSFMRSCYRKCNWTKPVPLMMSVDFTLEQTGPNFDLVFNPQFAYLCHFADWCACDHACGCPHLTCGAERGHEVAVPPEYSQSGQTMVPTQLFPWWPQLPRGTAAGTKSFSCSQPRGFRFTSSTCLGHIWLVGEGLSHTTGQVLLWDTAIMATTSETARTTKCCV